MASTDLLWFLIFIVPTLAFDCLSWILSAKVRDELKERYPSYYKRLYSKSMEETGGRIWAYDISKLPKDKKLRNKAWRLNLFYFLEFAYPLILVIVIAYYMMFASHFGWH